jgi:fibronectin type 3 domain-containing protein
MTKWEEWTQVSFVLTDVCPAKYFETYIKATFKSSISVHYSWSPQIRAYKIRRNECKQEQIRDTASLSKKNVYTVDQW